MTYDCVVYTAVFGNYDRVAEVDGAWSGAFVCFTDNPGLVGSGWEVVQVEQGEEDPAVANRRFKMLPHRYLASFARSLYIDANITLRKDPSVLFEKYLERDLVALAAHRFRNCAYAEAEACVRDGLLAHDVAARQIASYRAAGFPENYGLTENNVLFRRHNDPAVIGLMEAWWKEYQHFGRRDQVSLPFLLWQREFGVAHIEEGPRVSREYFDLRLHGRDAGRAPWSRMIMIAHQRRDQGGIYRLLSDLDRAAAKMLGKSA